MGIKDIIKLFMDNGIIKCGHFKLTSGKHSEYYINKDAIYCSPHLFRKITDQLRRLLTSKLDIDAEWEGVITGLAIAGAILAAPIANQLSVKFVYPEKIDSDMVFRRGYNRVITGKDVIIIEDIITTGKSVGSILKEIDKCGGNPIAIFSIWDRSGGKELLDVPLYSLISEPIEAYDPNNCILCKKGIPLEDPKTDTVIV